MKTSATFAQFDVVKFNETATVLTTCPNAVDFYGIVKEIGTRTSFVEWYNKKSKTGTAEAISDSGWVRNDDLVRVGSLYHLIVAGLTPATPVAAMTAAVEKPKRKYTRKEGAAKPGPKPKKEKADKAPKAKKVKVEEPVKTEPEIIYVPRPVNNCGKPITTEGGTYSWQKKEVLATGKFKYFIKRDDIIESIQKAGCAYRTKIDYNLDFAIVGQKPGPAKIEKFKRLGIPTITEEQWLALIGDPVYKFEDEQQTA